MPDFAGEPIAGNPMATTTAILQPCTKCGRPLGVVSYFTNDGRYHYDCIPEQTALISRPSITADAVRWPNGCDRTVPAALRYLADHDRPSGGEERFNSAHLFQLADEIERAAKGTHPAPEGAEPCPICGGDCASANPPVVYCPTRDKPGAGDTEPGDLVKRLKGWLASSSPERHEAIAAELPTLLSFLTSLRAERDEARKERDRLISNPGAERYWEARWRDEAARVAALEGALTAVDGEFVLTGQVKDLVDAALRPAETGSRQ